MDFLKNRYVYFGISGFLVVVSILVLIFGKLNLAIDMTGGISLEYSYDNTINIDTIREKLSEEANSFTYENSKVINNISVYSITGENAFSVVAGFDSNIEEKTLDTLKLQFRENNLELLQAENSTIAETQYVNIGKTFGDYIRNTAFLTLAIAAIAITIYITYAFSGVVSGISISSFSIITLITLFHDIIVAAGLYIIAGFFFKEFQVDTYFVTALLTILGYTINNTIVVFDRIRLNLKEYAGKTGNKGKNLHEIINMSLSATIRRSIYTSLTLLFVLITIFFFGPETLRGFILVMILGTVCGTFSSLLVAPQLLYQINKDKKLTVYSKKVERPEDKIVV